MVGFIVASHDTAPQLYVRFGLQRRGIGTVLLTWGTDQSSGHLSLYTFARTRAGAFYQRRELVDVARGFDPLSGLDAVTYSWSASTTDVGS